MNNQILSPLVPFRILLFTFRLCSMVSEHEEILNKLSQPLTAPHSPSEPLSGFLRLPLRVCSKIRSEGF